MGVSLTLPSVSCVTGATGGQVTFRVGTGQSAGDESILYWQLEGPNNYQNSGQYSEGTANDLRYFFTVKGLPDGHFRLTGSNEAGESVTREFDVACGPPPAALTLSATATNATAPGGTGTVTAQAGGGVPPLRLLLVEQGRSEAATAGQPLRFDGVPVGTHTVRVVDSAVPTPGQVQVAVVIADYAASGCTDSAALNPTPGATTEDGSCQYAPPVLAPFFAVPLLQSLRFAVRDGQPESFENTLFCEQTRPGQQVRPYFYQLVQVGDVVRVQVLTSYAAVRATISRYGGSQVAAVDLARVLTLDGQAAPLAVALRLDVASGTTQLRAAAGGGLPASLLAAARLTLAGLGSYRPTSAVPGSVVSLDDYVVVNRPWQQPPAGQLLASWPVSGPGFNVWEADLPLAGLASGVYQVQLRATQPGWADALAESEPLQLATTHKNTVVLDYRNADNCFGLVFSTGLTPRLRVPGTFFRQGNGGTESTYRATTGSLTVLASTATRLRQLETYALPAYLHEKIFLACRLDYLAVNGVRCQTDQAYEVSEERAYPLAGGRVALEQAEWLGQGNGDDFGVDETAPENALALRGGGYLLLRGR